jgi:putative ABC transport system permease protein
MWHDLRYAIRALRHNPGFTITAVLTLMLGIGANTVFFSVIKAVLLTPLPYPEPDRLVMVWQRNSQKGLSQERVTPANFADWRSQNQVFEHMGFYPAWGGAQTFRIAGKDRPERVPGAYASSGLFRALGVEPILGRTFVPEEDQAKGNQAAILSYALWQRSFEGAPDVLGRPVTVDTYGLRTYTIVGVMPPGFDLPDRSQIWLPTGWMGVNVPAPGASDRCCSWLAVVARLKPDSTLEQAQTQMTTIARRILDQHPESRESAEVSVVPLLDQMVGQVRRALLVLQGAVFFVLLIASANVASLMLSRAVARQKEIVMRAVLGAGRARIVRQSLIESLVLALGGGGLGLLLAVFSLKLVVSVGGDRVPRLRDAQIDLTMLGITILLSLLTGLLFGLAPALYASRLTVGGRQWTRRTLPARNFLVVSEIALATMLLVGAGLLIESFLRLQQVDTGFRPENVLTASFDMTGRSFAGRVRPRVFFHELMTRMRSSPGVVWAGGVSMLPLADTGGAGQAITIESRGILPAADSAKAKTGGATPDYFRAMGVSLLQGRFFTESDGSEAPHVAIINESMARRYWPGENPLGQRVALGSRERLGRVRPGNAAEPEWTQIVGVVADMRGIGLDAAPRPELYRPYWQWPWYEVELVIRTSGEPSRLAAAVRREAQDLDKDALITRLRTMDEIVSDSVAQPRFRAALLGVFAGSALLLAALGIYGVVSYSVTQRTREIGIRTALGAQRAEVLRMILREGLTLSTAGILIGLAGSLAFSRVISTLLFGVTATEPATLAAVSLLLTGVAIAASLVPARRATRVDPMVALRHE